MKGNAQECQGNVQERNQIARGMQGNGRGTYGSGCKVPGECRGMQGNARETYGSVNCQGNAGNAGECQGNVWQWVYSARGMQGTTRGMQVSVCKVLAE